MDKNNLDQLSQGELVEAYKKVENERLEITNSIKTQTDLIETLSKEKSNILKALKEKVITEKRYIPINDLKSICERYSTCDIEGITLVDDTGATKRLWNDEILKLEDDGSICYSSLAGGIFSKNESDGLYYNHFYGSSDKGLNIVGFFDLELLINSGETVDIKETNVLYLCGLKELKEGK